MSFSTFKQLCEQSINLSDYRFNSDAVGNVLVYDAELFSQTLRNSEQSIALQAELNHCLTNGSGVYVVRNGFADHDLIDRQNTVFGEIIQQEKQINGEVGDHFAEGGANDRIWNSLQKTCIKAPQDFIEYYSNDVLALASKAWLGPNYQMTAQVNIVKPSSKAQSPHRDYHLGFQSNETVAQYPLHAQVLSQYMTLQVVIAHSDMPIESGPTKLLPFSQQYEHGYLTWRDKEFSDYFEQHYIQYPFQKGDIAFLNPALFHAAGENRSQDIKRIANLMQIVSCMSKPLEAVDRQTMAKVVYPLLLGADLDEMKCNNIIAAVADGYSFPTNLDTDPPLGECAPQTMAELMGEALKGEESLEVFSEALQRQGGKRRA